MEIIEKYIHGSADSTDVDVYYVVDKMPDFAEAKAFCDSIKNENANLIEIEDGHVVRVYKGTPDECNNSLLRTFGLHPENTGHNLLVTKYVKRDVFLKLIRSIRIILSHLSRSDYRESIKQTLREGGIQDRMTTLLSIDFNRINYDSCGKNISGSDTLKVIAFQFGQIRALLETGLELYTKNEIADVYPELKNFLYRQSTTDDYNVLNQFRDNLMFSIMPIHEGDILTDPNEPKCVFRENGTLVTYDLRKEIRL